MKIPSVLLCLFSLLFITDAGATALMQWERLPLPVALHVGHERVVMVNKNVRVGYPAGLDGKLRIQSSGGTVYLKASAPFPDARLQLKDMDSGALILLDVSASDGEALEPVELHYDNAVYGNDATAHPAQEPDDTPPTTALPLAPAPVSASPLGAWQLAGDTVTAIRLQNQGAQRVTLDPRSLQGDFYAATFQHPWLGASGSPEDTTVVYLVTRGVQADRAILPEPQNTEKR